MGNNNQVRDILSEQEVKLFIDAVNSLGSLDTMPIAACHKILGLPELTDEFGEFVGDFVAILSSCGYVNDEEAIDKLEWVLDTPSDPSSGDAPLKLADGYGRYKDAYKASKRWDATERAKKRRIDRGRRERHYNNGSLQWSAGYLAQMYEKAQKALEEDACSKKKKKAVPLRWSEKKAYANTMRKCRRDMVFARHYDVYSTKKNRYFVRQPKANTEIEADVKASTASCVKNLPNHKGTQKREKLQPIKRLTFVNGKPFVAPVSLLTPAVSPTPAKNQPLANFFRGIVGHLSYSGFSLATIKTRVTGWK